MVDYSLWNRKESVTLKIFLFSNKVVSITIKDIKEGRIKKRKEVKKMDVFSIQGHRVTKRLLVDALHALGLRGNSTTARDELWARLKNYLESNGLSVAPIKNFGIVSYSHQYSDTLKKAYEQAGQFEKLHEDQSLICSWFIKNFRLSNKVVPNDNLSQNRIVIVPEETPTGALKSLIEKGI